MQLSRGVPARTKTVKFCWCRKDFMEMSQTFRDIRGKSRNPMDKCFWCQHAFVDGEIMALAAREKASNVTLCQACADELLAGESPEKETRTMAGEGCRWWSQMVAESLGCGPIEALCLNPESNEYQRMVRNGCNKHETGRAVDDPTPAVKPPYPPTPAERIIRRHG